MDKKLVQAITDGLGAIAIAAGKQLRDPLAFAEDLEVLADRADALKEPASAALIREIANTLKDNFTTPPLLSSERQEVQRE